MIEVDHEVFRIRNAAALIEHGLEAVSEAQASEQLAALFKQEAKDWLELLPYPEVLGSDIARAWAAIDRGTINLLELVLLATEDDWEAWVEEARHVVPTVRAVMTAVRQSVVETVQLSVQSTQIVDVIGLAADYDLDLPESPAAWRSLSRLDEFQQFRLTRIAQLADTLVAEPLDLGVGTVVAAPPAALDRLPSVIDDAIGRGVVTGVTRPSSVDLLVDQVKHLTLVDLKTFVKELDRTFGTERTPPSNPFLEGYGSVESPSGGAGSAGPFRVVLESAGNDRVQVIKAVRELTSLGLGEAKAIVDGVPYAVLLRADTAGALHAKAVLEEAGATIELHAANTGDGDV